MKFKLVQLKKFCGEKASFYTILVDEGETLFGKFVTENTKDFQNELMNMVGRIKNMGCKNGATDNFFKLDESSDPIDDNVVALYDKPDKKLRLYCVKMSDNLIVLGGGGKKPHWVFKWQWDSKLKKEAEMIMNISKLINSRIEHGQLGISQDGLTFTGNLELI